MKKLMFMLGVAALAVTTQAATINWTCTGVYAGNTSDTVSGVAYLFLSTTAKSDVIAAMSGKGATAASTYLAANALKYNGSTYSWTGTDGTFTLPVSDAIDPTKVGSGLTVDGTTKYTLYAVIFDTATVTDASKFYVTQGEKAKAITVGDSTSTFSLGAQGTTARSQASGNWYAVAPEPTSGLLMLVGLGALALRRRRS